MFFGACLQYIREGVEELRRKYPKEEIPVGRRCLSSEKASSFHHWRLIWRGARIFGFVFAGHTHTQ